MISLPTANLLKGAGLRWRPALHDFFAIPERGLDERVFVIGDMLANLELLHGSVVVSFQGASEWALDSVLLSEVVWMPTEGQLRQAIEELLLGQGVNEFRLVGGLAGYRCEIRLPDGWRTFTGRDASEVYAQALLSLLS